MLHPTSCMTLLLLLFPALSTTARHWQGSGPGSHRGCPCCPQRPALPGASPSLFAAAGLPVVTSQPFLLVISVPGMQRWSQAACSRWAGREPVPAPLWCQSWASVQAEEHLRSTMVWFCGQGWVLTPLPTPLQSASLLFQAGLGCSQMRSGGPFPGE